MPEKPAKPLGAGVHDISMDDYLADPCPEPSLNRSIAHVLLTRSPRHAWFAHPRLNPNWEREHKTAFDLGSTAHALMLGDERNFAIIDATDWRKTEHKEARAKAYKDGKIPLLKDQWENVQKMVDAGRSQLHDFKDPSVQGVFRDGKPEQTIIWQEERLWFRVRLDWMPHTISDEDAVFYDYKTAGASAHPTAWRRALYDHGYDIQAALYLRGIASVSAWQLPDSRHLHETRFRFVVQEIQPPFALSVIELTPAALGMAQRRIDEAIRLWSWCLERDKWPGYPPFVMHIDPPVYVESAWLEHEERRNRALEAGDHELTMLGAG